MNLSPNEFWRLTPCEFYDMTEGHYAKVKRDRLAMTSAVIWIISGVRSKKRISVRDVARSIVGTEFGDDFRDDEMIAESRKRAREYKAKQKAVTSA